MKINIIVWVGLLLINTLVVIRYPIYAFNRVENRIEKNIANKSKLEEKLQQSLFQYAKKNVATQSAFVELKSINYGNVPFQILNEDVSFELSQPEGSVASGYTVVLVDVVNSKKKMMSRHYITMDVRIKDNVVIAKSKIARGKLLASEDLDLVIKDVTYLQGNYYRDKKEVIGKICKLYVNEKVMINPESLIVPTLLQTGNVVKVIAKNNLIKVAIQGVALQEGNPGDLIKVLNQHSKKTIIGKVIDKETVLIEF